MLSGLALRARTMAERKSFSSVRYPSEPTIGPPLDTAGRIDLLDGEIEPFSPLRAVLRVLPGEWSADADQDRRAGRGLRLRAGQRHGHEQRCGQKRRNDVASARVQRMGH